MSICFDVCRYEVDLARSIYMYNISSHNPTPKISIGTYRSTGRYVCYNRNSYTRTDVFDTVDLDSRIP